MVTGWMAGRAQVGNNLTLLSNWDNNNLPIYYNLVYNEVFGWHDGNGREYAILGSMGWTYFIEVTIPTAPVVRDSVAGTFGQCIHRDFKTYGHYCYGVADEGTSTLQIIDLSYLPDSVHLAFNSNQFFERAHNVFIDTTAGRLYVAGANTQPNGIIVLNIATNPEVPILLASVNNGSYTHDLSVRGDTAYMNNGYDGFRIMDFSIPTAPVMLAQLVNYPQQGYNHSNWLTEDGEYLVMCDETRDKSCKVVDVRNFGNLNIASMFRSALLGPADTASIPHNPLVIGNYAVIAYYHDGVQMFDISNRTAPVHVAGYDTYPLNTNYLDWYGAWGTYPFLPSGTVLGSDVHNGLFVFRVPFPFPMPITATTVTAPATCGNAHNGQATVTPSGGTAPYTYAWSSGQTTATVTTQLPGNYTVTISDRYGYNIVQTVTIGGPTLIQAAVQVVPESCPGTADGSIDLHVTGGVGGYSFLWSTGDMVEDLNGLTSGYYSVIVTDSAGCVFYDTVFVSFLQPAPPSVAGNDTSICDRSLLLQAQLPTQGTGHWAWIAGNGSIQNPNINTTWVTGLQQGPNLLGWVVFDGQCSNVDTLRVVVSSTAFIDAGADTVACSSDLQLVGSPLGSGQGLWWAVPNTVAFGNTAVPVTVASGLQPGQYHLFWSVTDGNCHAIDSIVVTVSRPPFAVFSFAPVGFSINFQDMSQYTTAWHWDFGDGNASALQNPSHAYAQMGVYNVCLVAMGDCGADTTCQGVNVSVVGTTGPGLPGARCWPNPFDQSLQIEVLGLGNARVEFQLLDASGRSLRSGTFDAVNGLYTLNLPGLSSGMYFVALRAGDQRWTTKVVKQ